MKLNKVTLLLLLTIFGALGTGIALGLTLYNSNSDLLSPFVKIATKQKKELPLNVYKIETLDQFPFKEGRIEILEKINDFSEYTSYLFSYSATGGTITGQLNLPKSYLTADKAIVLLRGYIPVESYKTGAGTKSAAGVFAKNGYITLAPDFLGYGDSDPEPENSWETRFIKPVNTIELIKALKTTNFSGEVCNFNRMITSENPTTRVSSCPQLMTPEYSVGIWAHSNGGQVALTALEALSKPIPTTLWAPVTAPFPYSVLFFSDEHQDEGKATRKWLSQFEDDYDVFDFSISMHLDKLNGPIILHHGTADEAALDSWSIEFEEKIELENEIREEFNLEIEESTDSASLLPKKTIDLKYYSYPGADHNMRPVWNNVIARDLEFFKREL